MRRESKGPVTELGRVVIDAIFDANLTDGNDLSLSWK